MGAIIFMSSNIRMTVLCIGYESGCCRIAVGRAKLWQRAVLFGRIAVVVAGVHWLWQESSGCGRSAMVVAG